MALPADEHGTGRRRGLRAAVAATVTVAVGTLAHLVVLVGRGRYLEDLCVTRAPAGAWVPPEFTVVRGPVADGIVGFRCEAEAAPQYHFAFTDPLPLLGTVVVLTLAAAVTLLAWLWALGARTAPGPAAPPA